MQNGNSLEPAWIGARLIKIKNTCPFDSVIELLSTAYIDNSSYKAKIDTLKDNSLTLLLMDDYVNNGPTKQIYQQRASILDNIYGFQNNVLDCKDNVTFLVSKILKDLPSCYKIKICENCGSSCELRTSIEVDQSSVSNLHNFIGDYFNDRTSTCRECHTICKTQINPGLHVMLDLEFALDSQFHRDIYPDAPDKINLSDLPTKIFIKGNNYILNGLIGYFPAHSEDEIGHYIAICRRVTNCWEIHDDRYMELERIVRTEKYAVKATLVMYSQV